jgi:hypothetical protein
MNMGDMLVKAGAPCDPLNAATFSCLQAEAWGVRERHRWTDVRE